jgi:hypothetical protein
MLLINDQCCTSLCALNNWTTSGTNWVMLYISSAFSNWATHTMGTEWASVMHNNNVFFWKA